MQSGPHGLDLGERRGEQLRVESVAIGEPLDHTRGHPEIAGADEQPEPQVAGHLVHIVGIALGGQEDHVGLDPDVVEDERVALGRREDGALPELLPTQPLGTVEDQDDGPLGVVHEGARHQETHGPRQAAGGLAAGEEIVVTVPSGGHGRAEHRSPGGTLGETGGHHGAALDQRPDEVALLLRGVLGGLEEGRARQVVHRGRGREGGGDRADGGLEPHRVDRARARTAQRGGDDETGPAGVGPVGHGGALGALVGEEAVAVQAFSQPGGVGVEGLVLGGEEHGVLSVHGRVGAGSGPDQPASIRRAASVQSYRGVQPVASLSRRDVVTGSPQVTQWEE